MTLADERLKELDTLSAPERVMLRCRVAADFTHKGQYEAAREALGELWLGVGKHAPLGDYPPAVRAEVLLQCGTLSGWLGSVGNVGGAQDEAKDMLSEAARLFEGMPQKVAEARYELGMCYWRLGSHDEARVVLRDALGLLNDDDVELKAKIHIRRTIVEVWAGRYYEALNVLRESEPVFSSANDALRGRWHGQRAIVLDKLATAEGNPESYDRAIIEYTAAIYHYEAARHERYCATNLNNLAMLLCKIGRYNDAHENLDRAQLVLTKLKDTGTLAQVDETRARVFIGEKRYREANRVLASAIQVFEAGGESGLLADAFTLQGVVWARLRGFDSSITILRKAVEIAEQAGALTQAGQAALTLIEEHGMTWRMKAHEVVETYQKAMAYLADTQDAEDVKRLLAASLTALKRFAGMELHDPNFTFYGAVHELEARLIGQALDLEGGVITKAAKRLGLKRQSLAQMLHARHRDLFDKRIPPEKRLRSIIRDPSKE
jgi:tetratricopeptide (TPR) repeat protein